MFPFHLTINLTNVAKQPPGQRKKFKGKSQNDDVFNRREVGYKTKSCRYCLPLCTLGRAFYNYRTKVKSLVFIKKFYQFILQNFNIQTNDCFIKIYY